MKLDDIEAPSQAGAAGAEPRDASHAGAADSRVAASSNAQTDTPWQIRPERRASYLAASEAALNWAMGRTGTVTLITIALVAVLFFLQWARPFLVPLTCGVILALLCNPCVKALARWGVPRAVSTIVLLLTLWGVGAVVTYSLQAGVIDVIDDVPLVADKVAQRVQDMRASNWQTVRSFSRAADALDRATSAMTGDAQLSTMRVQIESSAMTLRSFLINGWTGVLGFLAELLAVTFLVFFLLTSGPGIKRKFIRVYGRSLSEKKMAIHMVNDLTTRIQWTLLALSLSNGLHGVVKGFAFHLLGVDKPVMWGVATAIAHFLPYLGAGIIAVASLIAGIIQFPSLGHALMPAAVSLVIATLIGNLLTVWLQSRSTRMDSVSIFVGMLMWGWLWGPAGFIMGAPLMAMFKSVCDHVKPLRALGELMEATPRKRMGRIARRRHARGEGLARLLRPRRGLDPVAVASVQASPTRASAVQQPEVAATQDEAGWSVPGITRTTAGLT